MRIVLVEDSPEVAEVVATALTTAGHEIRVAATCGQARVAFKADAFDIAIVDVGLPDGTGLDLCRSLRTEGNARPIMLLTGHSDLQDRLDGFDAGADDYLIKPFAIAELRARVRALGRRDAQWLPSVRNFGALSIDRDEGVVRHEGVVVPFTRRELEIVSMVAWREGHIVPRDEVLETLWGAVSPRNRASLDVLVTRVRRKLAEHLEGDVIRTVRQVGYAWVPRRT